MPPAARAALAGCLTLTVAMGIGRFVYTPVLPFMVDGLGLTKSEAGLIASANYVGYLVGALAAAWFVPRRHRRMVVLAALAVSALTSFAMTGTASAELFAVIRLVSGIASAFALVTSTALVLDVLAGAGRPRLGGVHFAGVGCGIAVSAVMVSGLAAAGLDWRSHWTAGGWVTLAALAAVALLLPAPSEGDTREATGGTQQRLRAPLAALIAAYGLFGFGYVITATFISTLVRVSADLRETEPIIWLVVGLTAAPSVIIWNAVAGRIGTVRAFAAACVIEAIGVVLSVITSSAAGIVLAAGLLGGTFMGITGLGLVLARAMAPDDPSRTLGLMTAAFGAGQIVGPAFAGYSFDATGSFEIASFAAGGALVLAAALTPIVRRSAMVP